MSCQRVLAAQKANRILGYVKRNVMSRAKDEILPLCSALARPCLESCVQLWGPQCKKDLEPVRVGPEESLKDYQRAERFGVV